MVERSKHNLEPFSKDFVSADIARSLLLLKNIHRTLFKADDLRQAAEKHDAFLLKYFTLRDGEGAVFKGEVQRRDLSAIPDEGVPQAEQ